MVMGMLSKVFHGLDFVFQNDLWKPCGWMESIRDLLEKLVQVGYPWIGWCLDRAWINVIILLKLLYLLIVSNSAISIYLYYFLKMLFSSQTNPISLPLWSLSLCCISQCDLRSTSWCTHLASYHHQRRRTSTTVKVRMNRPRLTVVCLWAGLLDFFRFGFIFRCLYLNLAYGPLM